MTPEQAVAYMLMSGNRPNTSGRFRGEQFREERTCGSGWDTITSALSWNTSKSLPGGDDGGAGSTAATTNGTGGGGAAGFTTSACGRSAANVPMLQTMSWPPDMRKTTWGTSCKAAVAQAGGSGRGEVCGASGMRHTATNSCLPDGISATSSRSRVDDVRSKGPQGASAPMCRQDLACGAAAYVNGARLGCSETCEHGVGLETPSHTHLWRGQDT